MARRSDSSRVGPSEVLGASTHPTDNLAHPGRPRRYRSAVAVTRYVDAMAGRASRQRLRPAVVAFAAYAVLALALFYRAWESPRTKWIGDPGDPPKFMWYLRWNPYAVAHGMNPFFSHHIDSVHGVNLLWDTSVLLPSLVLAPVTYLLGPVFAFNVAETAALALSAWCAYLFYRRYVHSHFAAATGGLLYGFSPYAIAHAHGGHLNLSLVFTPPLVLLLLDEILVCQRPRPVVIGGALGLLTGGQLLISQEILVTEAITSVVGVVVLMLLCPRRVRAQLPYAARALGVALAVFVALAAAPTMYALFSSRRPHHGTLWGPNVFASDIYGFIVPTGLQQLRFPGSSHVTSRFTDSCCIADSHTYIGFPLILLLVVTAVGVWARSVVRFLTLLALAVLVLSLGPHLHVKGHVTAARLPESWLSTLPLVANLLASRFMLYFYLCAGLLVAIFLDGVWHSGADRADPDPNGPPEQLARTRTARLRALRSGIFPFGLAVFALAFLFPRVPFPATRATVPAFFGSAAVRRIPEGSVALVAPFARDTSTSDPMLWQAVAGLRYRTPEGYATGPDDSGRYSFLPVPTPLSTLMASVQQGNPVPPITPDVHAELIGELRVEHVQTVIVGPFAQHAPMVDLFTRLLGEAPQAVGGVDVWWNV
jgi:hypothetical protein